MRDPLEMGEPIRLLIIGAGKMGRFHGEVFVHTPGVDVVAIASRSGDTARKLADDLGVPGAGSDWRALIDQYQPTACVVAVTHALNEEVTREVVERGLHVLAEKPVAFSSTAVEALAQTASERGVIAMAAMNRRYYANVLAAIDAVRYSGRLLGVTAFAPDPVRRSRAEAIHEPFVYDRWPLAQTLHLIDLLRVAAGELEDVIAARRVNGGDDEANLIAQMQFTSGALVSYIALSSSGGDWEIRLHGESVIAELRPLEQGLIRIGKSSTEGLPRPEAVDKGFKPGLPGQAAAFADAVHHGGPLPYPASSFEDHARSVALAETIEQLMRG